jgi:hypothetical protein
MEKNKHFLVGVFDDQDELLHAIGHIRHAGVKIYEVYTPYPIHGLEHELGYKRSYMPRAAFLFGATGTTLAITMQTGMMGVDWPMIIGGKSFLAIPDFVPVTFESTVLLASFGMVGTFLVASSMHPLKAPRLFDRRATDDKLIMAIDLGNNSLSEEQIKAILKENHTSEVYRKDFTDEDNKESFFSYLVDLFTKGVTSSSRKLK